MKNNSILLKFIIPLMVIGLLGCRTNTVLSPNGTVPKRNALPYDAYGGYITVQTLDSASYSGELIGMRHDTLVILSNSLIFIEKEDILTGQIVVYAPNSYKAGYLMAIPNLFLFGLVGNYGSGPLLVALMLTGLDVGGVGMARGTERKKKNYFDWSAGGSEVVKYSRFPHGIPLQVDLATLRGRPVVDTQSRK